MDLYSQGGTVISIEQWQIASHRNYSRFQAYYDVAVIYLNEPLKYNDLVQPICLPKGPVRYIDDHQGQYASLLGKS